MAETRCGGAFLCSHGVGHSRYPTISNALLCIVHVQPIITISICVLSTFCKCNTNVRDAMFIVHTINVNIIITTSSHQLSVALLQVNAAPEHQKDSDYPSSIYVG